MPEIVRVSPKDTREKVVSGSALLVCAYDDEEKCKELRLDGALSLNEFRDRINSLPKGQEVIFYCA